MTISLHSARTLFNDTDRGRWTKEYHRFSKFSRVCIASLQIITSLFPYEDDHTNFYPNASLVT